MHTKNKTKEFINFLKNQPKGYTYSEKKISNKEKLEKLKSQYKNCEKCPLAKQGRSQVVFGKGNPDAKLMFIGEGPGRDEDKEGVPFIGRAGKLLTKMISAMKLTREEIYISNVVKCRPPNNRAPLPTESQTCKNSILFREISIIQPKIICCLGASAMQAIIGGDIKISKARGIFFEQEFQKQIKIKVIPTFHPAYLLRNPSAKRLVWEDLQKIIANL